MPNVDPPPFEAAPLDAYAERVTTTIATIGGVLMLPALFWFLSGILLYGVAVPGVVISTATAVALAAWLALNYAVQPVSYELRGTELRIRRRWARPMRVPLRSILGVSPAPSLADVPRRGLRRSFNAGVYGYQGPFELTSYGRVFFVATHRERLVAVAREGQLTLVLSPARPRDFTEALREALIREAGGAPPEQPPAAGA